MLKDLLLSAAAILPLVLRSPRPSVERELVVLPMPPALTSPPSAERSSQRVAIAGPRRAINRHEATMLFCAWMRDWGFVGWYPAVEVLECYREFCAEYWLEDMGDQPLLEMFQRAPGVTKQRHRLGGAKDVHLKRICREHGERVVLYRVSSHEEMAEAAQAYVAATPAKKTRKRSTSKAAPAEAAPLQIAA